MPAKSASQYGLMQAVSHGNAAITGGPSRAVAKEFVAKTPAKKRKKFAEILAKKRGK